jgi:hypothetical protein
MPALLMVLSYNGLSFEARISPMSACASKGKNPHEQIKWTLVRAA